jgi:hypothetical protein
MPINFCGEFIILAKTLTMANSRRQALIQRRKRAMNNASGASQGFERPAGDFQNQSGRVRNIPMRTPLRVQRPTRSRNVAQRAAMKLIPFI